MADDLSCSTNVDLAAIHLDFEGFRRLSRNPHLSENERIGFPDSYRRGFDEAIFADILSKLPVIRETTSATVLDIGPGCAQLPKLLIELCKTQTHRLHLMDSEEMVAQIPDVQHVTVKHAGMFPRDSGRLNDLAGRLDAILCYSVFHYIFIDANPFEFIDCCMNFPD